jgi:hypothetical protein
LKIPDLSENGVGIGIIQPYRILAVADNGNIPVPVEIIPGDRWLTVCPEISVSSVSGLNGERGKWLLPGHVRCKGLIRVLKSNLAEKTEIVGNLLVIGFNKGGSVLVTRQFGDIIFISFYDE